MLLWRLSKCRLLLMLRCTNNRMSYISSSVEDEAIIKPQPFVKTDLITSRVCTYCEYHEYYILIEVVIV